MKNEQHVIVVALLLLHYVTNTAAFVPGKTRQQAFCSAGRTSYSPRYSTTQDDVKTSNQEQEEEPLLSDLDARVLNSMLDNEKLDLETEDNMRKLLERGVAPKTVDAPPKIGDQEDDDGQYSSALFKKLSSEGLWKSVKAKAGEVLESVQIFVANRIERDAKLLAAVGFFAWERAIRDVARALPESGRSGAAVGRAVRMAARQLSNTSSYEDNVMLQEEEEPKSVENLNLYEELNTPMDEIRSVTQSILDILSSDPDATTTTTNAGGRGLRTVAPAGQVNNAARQRLAYQRRKDTVLKREKEGLDKRLGRAAGGITDAAWEMQREMKAETSKPGYRTEGARKAIKAGAEQTVKTIQAAKEEPGGWKRILFGEPKEKKKLKMKAVPVGELLLEERSRVMSSIRECLEAPDETWLVPDVLNGCVSDDEGCPVEIDDEALQEVVTSLICLRDDLEATEDDTTKDDSEQLLEELKRVKGAVEAITSLAAVAAGYRAAESLSNVLYGQEEGNEPTLFRLDELEAASFDEPEQVVVEDVDFADVTPNGEVKKNVWFANVKEFRSDDHPEPVSVQQEPSAPQAVEVAVVPEIIDVSPKVEVMEVNGDAHEFVVETASSSAAAVEIVSDEDFEEAFGAAKSTSVLSEDEMELEVQETEEQEESFFVKVSLRTLDVVVFVVEKVLTVGIPGIFTIGKTASSRFAQVNRDGLGYKGWKKLGNVKGGQKKY